jgi:hypothetical protein
MKIKILELMLLFVCFNFQAKADIKVLSFGAFVENQYAYDWNSPSSGDRAFTTQPARHNEFNINLAFAEMKYETEKMRSRLALQAGTSVQANYLAEPSNGTVSGGDLSRHIQEARIGYKLTPKTWIDAGIFFSHVGAEGWISKDNLVLTRSLVADYSPYYLSGVKISHELSNKLKFLFLVTNGWQNTSENNQDKNLGTGLELSLDKLTISYNNLIGQEVSPAINNLPRSSQFRHFHDFLLKSRDLENWEWVAQYDIGFQNIENESESNLWQGALVMTRYKLDETQKVSVRVEYYQDQNQILLITNTPNSFEGFGGSIGFDKSLEDNVLWRLEARYLKANAPVFPKNKAQLSDENVTCTTSLSIQF